MPNLKTKGFTATLIGSLPHTDPEAAVRLVLDVLDEAPTWPELPRHSFLEGFIAMHTAGLPGLVLDEDGGRVQIDTKSDCTDALTAFYERALSAEQSGDQSAFALDERHASALEPTARALAATGRRFPLVKLHVAGPISFQLGLTDTAGRPLYYDETFADVLARQIQLQARSQVRRFAPYAEQVLVFLDEPTLAAYGSSGQLGVLREDVVARIGATVDCLHAEGALVGVHVCGNTDWSMIVDTGADVLNCDAYAYGEALWLYPESIAALLARGGGLAFGIVPTSTRVREEDAASLQTRLFSLIDGLAARGLDRRLLIERSMITPACGMGTLAMADTERVIGLLVELKRRLRHTAG